MVHLFSAHWFIMLIECCQLTIQARDLGSPQRNSEGNARVVVRVARNNHAPEFQQSYTAEINRDVDNGFVIADVVAVDRDTVVRHENYL